MSSSDGRPVILRIYGSTDIAADSIEEARF